ncbi:MAG: hypothetical protein JSS98_11980 [Bacteroidetes bacterium]|nr:hypothetical protein [Bacteroidota bacterium]
MNQATDLPALKLSKSTFLYGCQCHRRLWLYKNCYNERELPDKETLAKFSAGTDIGMQARLLFPGGVDASAQGPLFLHQSIKNTIQYIRQWHSIIYEAAFQYEGVYCALDILVKKKGKWYAFEVKSSLQVREYHISDAALQYFVISRSIPLEDFSIIHLSPEENEQGKFTATSVLPRILPLQAFIGKKIAEFREVLDSNSPPIVAKGDHCFKPFACDFQKICEQK